MRWNRHLRVCYLPHPRTGSHAMDEALGRLEGWEEPDWLPKRTRHPPWSEVEPHLGGDWKTFTVVRNHWDTVVSWYHMKRDGERPVTPGFVSWLLQRGTIDYVKPGSMWGYYGDHATEVLRWEQVQEEVEVIFDRWGLGEPPELELVNVSENRQHRDYRPYYRDYTEGLVRGLWWDEIVEYGYRFGR